MTIMTFKYFYFSVLRNEIYYWKNKMEWEKNEFGLEFIKPLRRDHSFLNGLIKKKTNLNQSYVFERKIIHKDFYLTSCSSLICHIPCSVFESIVFPLALGCFEIKKNGEKELSVCNLYYVGILEQRPEVITKTSPETKINGIEIEEDCYLFVLDKKKKKKPIQLFREEPQKWIYIYHFDSPDSFDVDFLSNFDVLQNAKARLTTLYNLSNGKWSTKIQVLNHPIDSKYDWMRDRFSIQFIILSLSTEELKEHIEWFVYAESIMIKNNLSLIKTIDDRILTMKLNGDEKTPFSIEYLVEMHKKRILASIEAIDQDCIDENLKETFLDAWKDIIIFKKQVDANNSKKKDWITVDHKKKKFHHL